MPYPDSEYPSILRGKDKRDSQRLLAAAPALLAACQAVRNDCQRVLDGDDFSGMSDGDMFGAFLDVLNAAIHKAEGRGE
jgi:hypothetical protein